MGTNSRLGAYSNKYGSCLLVLILSLMLSLVLMLSLFYFLFFLFFFLASLFCLDF